MKKLRKIRLFLQFSLDVIENEKKKQTNKRDTNVGTWTL